MTTNKFKLIYDKKPNDGKLNGSITGIPGKNDTEIAINNVTDKTKLIYEDTKLVGGKVTKEAIPTSGFIDKVYINTAMSTQDVKTFVTDLTGKGEETVLKIYTMEEIERLMALPGDLPEVLIIIAISPIMTTDTSYLLFTGHSSPFEEIYYSNWLVASQEIKLYDIHKGWNLDNITDNYLDIKDNYITKAELEKILNVEEGTIPEDLWRPGSLNEEWKELFYIEKSSGEQKEVKILKASEKEIPTKDDKEVCELDTLIIAK